MLVTIGSAVFCCLVVNPSQVVDLRTTQNGDFVLLPFGVSRLVGAVALGWRSGARARCCFLPLFSPCVVHVRTSVNVHLDSCDRTHSRLIQNSHSTAPSSTFSKRSPRDKTQASQLAGKMFFKRLPKDPSCEICKLVKTTRDPCKSRHEADETVFIIHKNLVVLQRRIKKFLMEVNESRLQYRYTVVVQKPLFSMDSMLHHEE